MTNQAFQEQILEDYKSKGDYIVLGGAKLNDEAIPNLQVTVPLKTLSRHGLITGATGTGKTKTVQVLAERFSEKGIPSLIMDMKGDLSGISQPGTTNKVIEERESLIGIDWQATAYPTEFMTISKEAGLPMRATVIEFGPILFSKLLDLNENQSGIVALCFQYADDNQMPLIDLKDFKQLLTYLTNDGKDELKENYGMTIASNSTSSIMRKIIEIEQQGADRFFAEKSFEVPDLLREDEKGNSFISLIRLTDIQGYPKLFSTFMLSLLAEIYETFPEEGELNKPKLMIFIDEAHLIFDNASKALLEQLEMIVKLIRSKGVGLVFCTQNPSDIPEEVLGQLGLRIQHALRAVTAKDRKNIKLISENLPSSDFYETNKLISELGIGEALVSCLDEKGRPTSLVHTLISPPKSRMDTITKVELMTCVNASDIIDPYLEKIDNESAYEILKEKISKAKKEAEELEQETAKKKPKHNRMSLGETMAKQAGRTFVSYAVRGLMGALIGKGLSKVAKKVVKSLV
jgi:DNA helicase HerA-like ATPase